MFLKENRGERMQKNSTVKTIYSFAAVVLLTVFFQVVFCFVYNFDYETSSIVLYALICTGALSIFTYIPKIGKIFIISILLFLGVVWLISNDNFTEIFADFFYWFIDYSLGHISGDEGNIEATKVISFILIICLFYLLQQSFFGRIACSLIVIAVCVFCGYYEYHVSRIIIDLALIYIVLVGIEISLRFNQKIKNEKKRLITISRLMPFVVAIVFIVNLIPASEEPLQWEGAQGIIKGVKSLYHDLTTNINSIKKGKNRNNDKQLGFSDGIKLGGSISNNNTVAMEIKFNKPPKRNVYLMGAVSDTYSKNSWKRNNTEPTYYSNYYDNDEYSVEEYVVEYLEMYYSLMRSGLLLRTNEMLESNTIEVEYKGIDTDNLFYISRINKAIISVNNFYSEGSTLLFGNKEIDATKYKLSYSCLDQSSPLFKKYIDRNIGYNYEKNELSEYGTFPQETSDDTGNESLYYVSFMLDFLSNSFVNSPYWYDVDIGGLLQNRASKIKNVYTQLPNEIPQRVYDLAEQITAGKANDYEKLKAIESYLKNNYTYSKKPGNIPKGRDAVDYFLFESKKGYCEYFASSMAVLARCVGIPTRIAQGYLVEVSPYGSKTVYEVTESNAHAWVEGYIEGVGWIPFEPTANYSSFTDEEEKTHDSLSEDLSSKDESSSSKADSSKADDRNSSNNDTSSVQDDNTSIVDESKDDVSKSNVEGALYISLIILIVIIILIPTISYLKIIMTFKKYKKIYEGADSDKKVYMDFFAIMRLLERNKITICQGETLVEFVNRINDFEDNIQQDINDSIMIYMKLRYGGLSVTDDEQKKAQITKQRIENIMKEKLSALGYFNLSYKIAKNITARFK